MSHNQHRALVRNIAGELELVYVSTPSLEEGQLLVKLKWVGICGTDLDFMRGARIGEAKILGHEGVGAVQETTNAVAPPSRGDRVVFNPVSIADQNHILGHSYDGLLQEYYLVGREELSWGQLCTIPNTLRLVCGPLVEPLSTVVYGSRLIRQQVEPESVLVIGAGPIGILHTIFNRRKGVSQVLIVCKSVDRARWLIERDFVCDDEVLLGDMSLAEHVLYRTRGRGVDATIVCTPRSATVDAYHWATQVTRCGGVVDLVSSPLIRGASVSSEVLELESVRRENVCGEPAAGKYVAVTGLSGDPVWVTGHRGSGLGDMDEAIAELTTHTQEYLRIITHLVTLEALPELMRSLKSANERRALGSEYVKALVRMDVPGKHISCVDLGVAATLAVSDHVGEDAWAYY